MWKRACTFFCGWPASVGAITLMSGAGTSAPGSSPPSTGRMASQSPFVTRDDGTTSDYVDTVGAELPLELFSRIGRKNGRCLNFMHIPKTAGTSIEEEMHMYQVKMQNESFGWGLMDKHLNCTRFSWTSSCKLRAGRQKGACNKWHAPPAFDGSIAAHYKECDTFCVVRNPYTRIISEFKYSGMSCKTSSLKKYVSTATQRFKANQFVDDCHLLPMSVYIYGQNQTKQDTRKPFCDRILRFENLSDEFNELTKEYDIPITLKTHHNAASHSCNIDQEHELVRPMVEELYSADLRNFAYSI